MQRRTKLILLTFSQNDVYINSSGHILHSGLVNCRSQFIGASWQHWMNGGGGLRVTVTVIYSTVQH